MVKVLGEEQNRTGKKLLWGTACLFAHPRYAQGAGTSPSLPVYAYAAAQVRKALEVVCFWRDGVAWLSQAKLEAVRSRRGQKTVAPAA